MMSDRCFSESEELNSLAELSMWIFFYFCDTFQQERRFHTFFGHMEYIICTRLTQLPFRPALQVLHSNSVWRALRRLWRWLCSVSSAGSRGRTSGTESRVSQRHEWRPCRFSTDRLKWTPGQQDCIGVTGCAVLQLLSLLYMISGYCLLRCL